MLSHQIKLRIFCLKSVLLMSLDFIANTSHPVDYMEKNSIRSYVSDATNTTKKPQHLSLPRVSATAVPEKGIHPPENYVYERQKRTYGQQYQCI